MNNKLCKYLIKNLLGIQEQDIWLDENFQKKIETISVEEAFQRPLPDLHSVAELLSHLVVWRQEALLKFKGESSGLSMDSPRNWLDNKSLKKQGWQALKSSFYKSNQDLIDVLSKKEDSFLETEYSKGYTYGYLLEGLLHHDLYHLGQMGTTIKFLRKKNP